jgi:SagB-type dehydrogenase family enzyme
MEDSMKIKNFILILFIAFSFCLSLFASNAAPIKLNAPDKDRGLTIMKALAVRASVREWNGKPLEIGDLSDLLWAANGINRPDKNMRTAPSYRNAQDISLYVLLKDGAYLYDPKENILSPIAAGDFRAAAAGGQKSVKNSGAVVVLVSDLSKIQAKDKCEKIKWAAVDAGIVVENICLFCAATGLVTVPRATMDTEKLRTILKLKDTQEPLMNNPVGYGK